jgi:hypothetical protein
MNEMKQRIQAVQASKEANAVSDWDT